MIVSVRMRKKRRWRNKWIRASSPRRGRLKLQEETKAFLSCTCHIDFQPQPGDGAKGSLDLTISNVKKEGGGCA